MRREVNGVARTFLLKKKKTPAKKLRLLFFYLKACLKEVFEEYHQFARSGKPRCLRRDRQVEVLNGGETEGMIREGLPIQRRMEWEQVSA